MPEWEGRYVRWKGRDDEGYLPFFVTPIDADGNVQVIWKCSDLAADLCKTDNKWWEIQAHFDCGEWELSPVPNKYMQRS